MSLAIHGTPAHTHDTTGTTTTVSASITTTVANTIVIAVVAGYNSLIGGTLKTVTGVAGGGLTWTKRSAQAMHTTSGSTNLDVGLEVWWAQATGTLTAQSITATFNAAPNQRCDIMVFAVSGSNHLSAPWDVNASAPATAQSAGTTPSTPSKGITTTATNSMLLGFLAYAWNANAANTVGTGFTDILAATTDNSLRDHWEEKLVSSSGAQTINFTGTQQFWVIASDALNGDAASGATGTITTSLTKASQSLAGTEKITGSIATNLTKASFSALSATEAYTGTITTRLSALSQTLAGVEKFTGTTTTHLSALSQALAGNEKLTGTITTALQGISQIALHETVTGDIATALRGVSMAAPTQEIFVGDIVTNIDQGATISMVAETFEVMIGTIVTQLSRASFALNGIESITGTIHTNLGAATGALVANVANGAVIITGTIDMQLTPVRSLTLAAQLGLPGGGNWYSWRQPDS